MKAPHLLALGAATAAVLIFAASGAEAQPGYIGRPPLSHHGGHHGNRGFFIPFFAVEQQAPVVIEREIVREVPVVVEAPPPKPPPREPYAIGKSYATLPPSGCMKMIEDSVSYYMCSGEWYRQVGSGSAVTYKAVARR